LIKTDLDNDTLPLNTVYIADKPLKTFFRMYQRVVIKKLSNQVNI